jgi:predicted aspartyl protease
MREFEKTRLERRRFLALGLAACLVGPATAEDDCRMRRLAKLPMQTSRGMVVVQNALGDKPLNMLLDTGAYYTCFSESKVAELGMAIETRPDNGVFLYGGTPLRRVVSTADFRIGAITTPRYSYPLMPPERLPDGVDGLLGGDFLGNFDLDIDFAGGMVNLFSKEHCPGRVGYWTTEKLEPIALQRQDDRVHICTHVTLDGEDVRALIDTGASLSTLSLGHARRLFGIADTDPRLTEDTRFRDLQGCRHFPFKQMHFGHVSVEAPDIVLVPERESQMGPDPEPMILGLTVLRKLHVYIAYRENNLYVTAADVHG